MKPGISLFRRRRRDTGRNAELISRLHSGQSKYASMLNYPSLTWADIGAIGWLVDSAAIVNQVSLQNTSYGPHVGQWF